jgi:hypothetical protein
MNWISVEDRYPIALETGDWDGKRSDFVLTCSSSGVYHIARLYSGFLDGSDFNDWVNHTDDYILSRITHWQYLPELP